MDRRIRWKLACPECEYEEVHLSRMRWYERPWRLLGRRMYRCYMCGARFLHRTASTPAGASRAPDQGSGGPGAACPNCGHRFRLVLSNDERLAAQASGWFVSCPQCRAAFVYHAT